MNQKIKALREVAERIVRDVTPATPSGQTCFVPRYQIAQLETALDDIKAAEALFETVATEIVQQYERASIPDSIPVESLGRPTGCCTGECDGACDGMPNPCGLTDQQCEAIFRAVSLANLTRDVKSPERMREVVRDAIVAGVHGVSEVPEAAPQPAGEAHPDNLAVDRFAAAMKAKLAAARAKGRGGWDGPECNADILSSMLRDHVEKGDPRDVANFCMFLHQRGEAIQPAPSAAADGSLVIEPTYCTCHPETCCHGDYTLRIGETKITDGSKDQLCKIVSGLGRLSAPAAVTQAPADVDALAEQFADAITDRRGRKSWEFDNHNLHAFAARLSGAQQAEKTEKNHAQDARAMLDSMEAAGLLKRRNRVADELFVMVWVASRHGVGQAQDNAG